MITYVKMNIFESPAQVIVNTVNTVGVMGKGIAKQYKTFYPEMFKEYQKYCEAKLLEVGKLWIYKTENKWVLNFPTKKHWRSPSKIEYIEKGLQKFVDTYEERGIRSISFPPLGCGNGGLNWDNEVKPLMEKYLKNIDIDVFIHLPMDMKTIKKREHQNVTEIKKWLHSEPNALSFIEVWEDVKRKVEASPEISHSRMTYNITINYSETFNDDIITFRKIKDLQVESQFTKDELSEAWKLLRQNGVLTEKVLPSHLKESKREIYFIMLTLPYVDTITVLSIKNGKEINETGIRLKPLANNEVIQEVLSL